MHLSYEVPNILGTDNSDYVPYCVRAILWVICLNKSENVKPIH